MYNFKNKYPPNYEEWALPHILTSGNYKCYNEYVGNFEKGVPSGEGIVQDRFDNIVFSGSFEKGRSSGHARIIDYHRNLQVIETLNLFINDTAVIDIISQYVAEDKYNGGVTISYRPKLFFNTQFLDFEIDRIMEKWDDYNTFYYNSSTNDTFYGLVTPSNVLSEKSLCPQGEFGQSKRNDTSRRWNIVFVW